MQIHLKVLLWSAVLSSFLLGCQTTKTKSGDLSQDVNTPETTEDVVSALGSVSGAMSTGTSLTEEELRDLAKDLRKDPEAQSAVEAITQSVSSSTQRVKYSPATGKRYAPHLTVDPETGVPLKWVEEE